MTAFQLDTSGRVESPFDYYEWRDLAPFKQGYLRALFDDLNGTLIGGNVACGFSDLSPEALAWAVEDCNDHPNGQPHKFPGDSKRQARAGGHFWTDRQAGGWAAQGWSPLAPYFGDDGRVYLRECGA